MVALVPLTERTALHWRFQDCIASYRRDDGNDPETGYGEKPPVPDKHGETSPAYSTVCGTIGGGLEVEVYPRQFDLPAAWGTVYWFYAGPGPILLAAVRAVREEHFAPEYVI